MCTDSLGPGTGSGTTEPGEDHVAVLSVHGDLHGPGPFRGKLPGLHSSGPGVLSGKTSEKTPAPLTHPYAVHVQITIEAMKSDIDEVALQGIEFWSNVCDEEMDLAIEASEVQWAVFAVLDNPFSNTMNALQKLYFCGL